MYRKLEVQGGNRCELSIHFGLVCNRLQGFRKDGTADKAAKTLCVRDIVHIIAQQLLFSCSLATSKLEFTFVLRKV